MGARRSPPGRLRRRLGRRLRDERGSVAVFTALVSLSLMVVAGFSVDLGNTWARRGQLQVQADRAAVYAARFLPAVTADDRTRVARGVAFYLACNAVAGQRQLHPEIPACTDDPQSATLDTYATALLDAVPGAGGSVTIPAENQVAVLTPTARVDFGLAQAAGASGTDQQKKATARVNSPGIVSPMALSLDCLVDPVYDLAGGGLPFGYISTTHQSPGGSSVETTWPDARADPKLNGVVPGRIDQQLVGVTPTVEISGSRWPELAADQRLAVEFRRGAVTTSPVTGTPVVNEDHPRRLGYLQVQVPSLVAATAGEWELKVVTQTGSTNILGVWEADETVWSRDTSTIVVDEILAGADDLACGRLLKSPRAGTQANVNFVHNLQEGIDHLIVQYPYLFSSEPADLDALRNLVLGETDVSDCNGSGVSDTNGSGQTGQTPNCVVTNMSNAYERGFTEGMIGPEGRLACTEERPCAGDTFLLNGVRLNNDRFEDYVLTESALSWRTFFNTDAYLDTGLPVITPESNLSRDIYASHRFMWVAVISTTGAVSAVEAGDYPVLTFRPIFITQSSALEELPLLDDDGGLLGGIFGSVLDLVRTVDDSLQAALQPGLVDQEGLLVDSDGDLSAVRFMTIAPDALPAVPTDYTGAESEYVGVGPRIIRLVE